MPDPTDPVTPAAPTVTTTPVAPKPVLKPIATTIATPVLTNPIRATLVGTTTPIATTLPITPLVPPVPINIPPINIPPMVGVTDLSTTNPKVTTAAPNSSVAVTVPNTSGQVTLSLVVTDNLGIVSQPATVTINIQSPPVAVLTADPTTVTPGGTIKLSGANSTSSGSIQTFTFSLVSPT